MTEFETIDISTEARMATLEAVLRMGLQLGESGKHGGGDDCPTCHFVREARKALAFADEWDVSLIQRKHFASWIGREVWAIIELPNGNFQVYEQSRDGVAPQFEYPTLRKAAARLLQIMGTGAVAPQTWPESACIGKIVTEGEAQ